MAKPDEIMKRVLQDLKSRNGYCRCGVHIGYDIMFFSDGRTSRAVCKGCPIASDIAGRHVVQQRE